MFILNAIDHNMDLWPTQGHRISEDVPKIRDGRGKWIRTLVRPESVN